VARKDKKSANGEGSVFQRKDGYWVAHYSVTSHGDTKYRKFYGKTQKEAIHKRDEARTRENSGLVFEAGRTTVGECLDRWLEESVKGSVKQRTYDSYSTEILRHVIPAFRCTKLKQDTRARAKEPPPSIRSLPPLLELDGARVLCAILEL
jgi:integrase